MSWDVKYMREALRYAEMASELGEVPIGAVVIKDDVIIGYGYNRRETDKSAIAHAEIEAIKMACDNLSGWRLFGSTLYVTLEPCPMCAGAIINSRIDQVVFGAYDKKAGSCGTLINLFNFSYNHKPEVVGGIMEEECGAILTDFFKKLRNKA